MISQAYFRKSSKILHIKPLIVLLSVLLTLLLTGAVGLELRRSTVRVLTETATGSGVQVREGILTCYHVIVNDGVVPDTVVVRSFEGLERPAQVIRWDRNRDLALLSNPLPDQTLTSLAESDPLPGEDVWACGNGGSNHTSCIKRGVCSEVTRNYLVSDCLVVLGDSGGPMVDLDARLCGLIRAIEVQDGQLTYSYAIKLASIRGFLGRTY